MAAPATRARQAKPATITVTLSADVPILQTLADASNPWKLQNQALVTLVRVAQGTDPYYALEAGKFLLEYATNEVHRREAKKIAQYGDRRSPALQADGDRQAILNELKGLYEKALGTPPLIVEAETESSSSGS